MTTNPSHPPQRRSAPHPSQIFKPTAASRIVWLRIAFSARCVCPQDDVDRRLTTFLRPSGITVWMTDRALALLRDDRPIGPAEWSAVIGWLLCQPEVVFVARVLPLTSPTTPTRGSHGQAR